MSPDSSRRGENGEDGSPNTNSTGRYVMYRGRWLVLSVCCFLALSNAMQWLAYSSLSQETSVFYCGHANGETCSVAFWTNQIFQGVAALCGLAGMYLTDFQGIKTSSLCGVALNLVGAIIRLLSSLPSVESQVLRVVLLHSGSVVAASAGAVFLVLPSKIAECWFAEDQRTLANVLSFVANPLGVVLGSLIPQFILMGSSAGYSRYSWGLFYFNLVMAALAALPFVLALFIRNGLPPTPPSAANENHQAHAPSFHSGLIICLSKWKFYVQMFTFGMGFALLWGVTMVLPDVVDTRNYNLKGNQIAFAAFVGAGGSILAGWIADKTKAFKEIVKISSVVFFLSAFFTRLYLERTCHGWYDQAFMFFTGGLLGLSSIPLFPIGVEMGVETCYPVFEATSSGILVISAQLIMFLVSNIIYYIRDWGLFYGMDGNLGNWRLSLDVWVIMSGIYMLVCVMLLNPSYERLAFEHPSDASPIKPNLDVADSDKA